MWRCLIICLTTSATALSLNCLSTLFLQVVRLDVLYWEAGDDAVSHAYDEGSMTLPAFAYYGYERCDYFGHPAYEYPGLVKVLHTHTYSIVVWCMCRVPSKFTVTPTPPVDMPVFHWPCNRS